MSGVNFLKGRNFFGGDCVYFAYFPESSGLAPASDVLVNGVSIGKVLNVEFQPLETSHLKKVKVTFTVTNKDIHLPIGTIVKITSIYLAKLFLCFFQKVFQRDFILKMQFLRAKSQKI